VDLEVAGPFVLKTESPNYFHHMTPPSATTGVRSSTASALNFPKPQTTALPIELAGQMDVDVIFAPCDFRLSQVYVFFTVMDPGFDFYNKGGGGGENY